MDYKKIIRHQLKQSMKCKFKCAWIPKGWAAVHIKTFIDDLDEELRKAQSTDRIIDKPTSKA